MSAPAKTAPTTDLTQRAPRSLRCRLGGFVHLPRLLDKCRASLAGKLGDYHYNCPTDQLFFNFLGIDADALKAEVARGLTDSQALDWIRAHAKLPRAPWEIAAWSSYLETRRPDSDPGTADYFSKSLGALTQTRTDILTWADLLDLDDHVNFGGTA